MEQLTTYTVKAKNTQTVWVFKYHLNGSLNEFKVLEGLPTEKQFDWLFKKGNFPYYEEQIKDWIKKLKANFEILKVDPVFSFEMVWNLYNNKVKRVEAEKQFNKLKQADVIKLFLSIPGYDKYLQKKGVSKAHLSTFINQRYFEDDWSKA
jgi:hypothetical protein